MNEHRIHCSPFGAQASPASFTRRGVMPPVPTTAKPEDDPLNLALLSIEAGKQLAAIRAKVALGKADWRETARRAARAIARLNIKGD